MSGCYDVLFSFAVPHYPINFSVGELKKVAILLNSLTLMVPGFFRLLYKADGLTRIISPNIAAFMSAGAMYDAIVAAGSLLVFAVIFFKLVSHSPYCLYILWFRRVVLDF